MWSLTTVLDSWKAGNGPALAAGTEEGHGCGQGDGNGLCLAAEGRQTCRVLLEPHNKAWLAAGVTVGSPCLWGVTLRLVLVKMTAWVMVSVSYRSHRVSNFHSSLSTATKNCLMPCTQPGHQ